jgi:hypothetical protein
MARTVVLASVLFIVGTSSHFPLRGSAWVCSPFVRQMIEAE